MGPGGLHWDTRLAVSEAVADKYAVSVRADPDYGLTRKVKGKC